MEDTPRMEDRITAVLELKIRQLISWSCKRNEFVSFVLILSECDAYVSSLLELG